MPERDECGPGAVDCLNSSPNVLDKAQCALITVHCAQKLRIFYGIFELCAEKSDNWIKCLQIMIKHIERIKIAKILYFLRRCGRQTLMSSRVRNNEESRKAESQLNVTLLHAPEGYFF